LHNPRENNKSFVRIYGQKITRSWWQSAAVIGVGPLKIIGSKWTKAEQTMGQIRPINGANYEP
jgi:hypothetical protein